MWNLNELFSGGGDDEGRRVSVLSPKPQRIHGFAASLGTGLLLILVSMIVFAIPIKFALLFTYGNVITIGSTAFLMGIEQHMNMLLDPVRIYASSVYIGYVVVALICALSIYSKLLTVIAILCETHALIWYSHSYIPFAPRMVSEIMIRL